MLPFTLNGSLVSLLTPERSVGGVAFLAPAGRFLAEARYGALDARRYKAFQIIPVSRGQSHMAEEKDS